MPNAYFHQFLTLLFNTIPVIDEIFCQSMLLLLHSKEHCYVANEITQCVRSKADKYKYVIGVFI